MKRIISMAALMVLLIGLASTPALAADATAALDLNSAYVWRGQTFNDGFVAQPSIDVATELGIGVNVWGNLDIDDYDGAVDSGEFSEIDLTLYYGKSFGKLDFGVGYIEYLFPTTETGGALGTREVYLSLAYGLPASLSVGLDFYYDFDEVEDYYSRLNVGWGMDLAKGLSLDAGLSAAYAGDAYSADGEAGFYDYNVSLSLGYSITEALSVALNLYYTDSLDKDKLADVNDGGPLDTTTYGGINIAYAF
jgi:hypothetical protein